MFRVPCSISTLWLPVTTTFVHRVAFVTSPSLLFVTPSLVVRERKWRTPSTHEGLDGGIVVGCSKESHHHHRREVSSVKAYSSGLNEKRAHTRFPVQFHTPTSYLIHCSWCWLEVYLISLTSTRLIAVAGDPPFRPNEMHPCHPQRRIACYTHEIGYVYSLRIRNIDRK